MIVISVEMVYRNQPRVDSGVVEMRQGDGMSAKRVERPIRSWRGEIDPENDQWIWILNMLNVYSQLLPSSGCADNAESQIMQHPHIR